MCTKALITAGRLHVIAVISSRAEISPYFQQHRLKIGRDLLLLPSVAAVIRDSDGRASAT
jgi:hypothetical protein